MQCFQGKIVWNKLQKRKIYHDPIGVILIPEYNFEMVKYVQKYLVKFLEKRQWESAVLILPIKMKKNIVYYPENKITIFYWTKSRINALLQYYRLMNCDDRLIVASFDFPEGRNGRQLIGLKGLTAERVFCVGIFGGMRCQI